MSVHALPIEPAPIVNECTAHEAAAMVREGEAFLVDVREVSEYENERIPGAFLMPLSFFDAEHFPWIAAQKIILHCAVGKRSAAAAKQLVAVGLGGVYNMVGGLNAWKDGGLPVETD
ncbi:rhodanese-like domain-containing protein [Varunaivibrio sulfuroxidans]|uniref:Rhodanese-related sulfurtransferase n=1 Tax=Varunaivibrio sulfuroxidans TaxID=1773489 RepID=A0A4R3J685_9PROT|nr:rhodanese-like domain-containing protein [Varunaivibrio sulfuroxidans]TCS60346.1 rhodanese-related sulfurtransferase [Varunaivibrio sulfuroxidans]WES30967.1 rhodanese-like domain-containing protein [Varunaivibrio sulfuroxidans]